MIIGSVHIVLGWVGFGFEAAPLRGLRLGLLTITICAGHWAERLREAAERQRGT